MIPLIITIIVSEGKICTKQHTCNLNIYYHEYISISEQMQRRRDQYQVNLWTYMGKVQLVSHFKIYIGSTGS